MSQTSWRVDLGNLVEMEEISPRSRRDLESRKHHGEISTILARFKSRQDLGNLVEMEEISPRSRRDLESKKHHGEILARSRQSWRDLSKNFAREVSVCLLLSSWCEKLPFSSYVTTELTVTGELNARGNPAMV